MARDTSGRPRPGAMAFVLLTVAASWSIWIAVWLATGRPATTRASSWMVAAIYAGSFCPGIVAAALSARQGRKALLDWLSGFARFRCGWRVYAFALLPLPLVMLVLTVVLGFEPRVGGLHGRPAILLYLTLFPVSLFNGLATALLGAGPLGEEGGWRGHLLPHLLECRSEASASIVIGIVWGLWHLPVMAMFADWRGNVPFATYLPLYMLGVMGLSFVLSRVWKLGEGSLVPCIWLHGLVNAVGGVAFDPSLWTSRWSPWVGTSLFAVGTAITAALLVVTSASVSPRTGARG